MDMAWFNAERQRLTLAVAQASTALSDLYDTPEGMAYRAEQQELLMRAFEAANERAKAERLELEARLAEAKAKQRKEIEIQKRFEIMHGHGLLSTLHRGFSRAPKGYK